MAIKTRYPTRYQYTAKPKRPKILPEDRPSKPVVFSVSMPYRYNVFLRATQSDGYVATSNSPSSQTISSSRNGVTNPRWKQQIRAGLNAATPYTRLKKEIEESPCWAVLRRTSGAKTITSYLEGSINDASFTSTVSVESVAEQRARMLFYKKLRDLQHVMAGTVFLGELRDTIHTIRKPFSTLQSAVGGHFVQLKRAVNKINGRRAVSPASVRRNNEKVIADTWLETSFGILPTLSDIDDGCKALATLQQQYRVRRLRVFSKAENASSFGTSRRVWTDALGTQLAFQQSITDRGESVVIYLAAVKTGCVMNELDYPSFSKITQTFGLGITQFVPTLWELMPWSFLIDYFTTVGKVVNAWATTTANVEWYVKTVKNTSERTMSSQLDTAYLKTLYGSTYLGSSSVLGPTVTKNWSMVRTIPVGVSLPTLAFDLNLSPMKVLNILALRSNMTAYVKKYLFPKP